jgi:hypothetical protein
MWLSSLNPEFTATTHINFKEIPHFSTKPRLTVLLIEALWERDLRWVSGISYSDLLREECVRGELTTEIKGRRG